MFDNRELYPTFWCWMTPWRSTLRLGSFSISRTKSPWFVHTRAHTTTTHPPYSMNYKIIAEKNNHNLSNPWHSVILFSLILFEIWGIIVGSCHGWIDHFKYIRFNSPKWFQLYLYIAFIHLLSFLVLKKVIFWNSLDGRNCKTKALQNGFCWLIRANLVFGLIYMTGVRNDKIFDRGSKKMIANQDLIKINNLLRKLVRLDI